MGKDSGFLKIYVKISGAYGLQVDLWLQAIVGTKLVHHVNVVIAQFPTATAQAPTSVPRLTLPPKSNRREQMKTNDNITLTQRH